MDESLGLVEVCGLACAVNAADAMLKAADVKLVAIEKAKGGGWMTVEVTGDVGSVEAAVSVGQAQAAQIGALVSTKVIARPAQGIADILVSPDSFGLAPKTGGQPEAAGNQAAEAKPVAVAKPAAPHPPEPKKPTGGSSAGKPSTPPQKRKK